MPDPKLNFANFFNNVIHVEPNRFYNVRRWVTFPGYFTDKTCSKLPSHKSPFKFVV